MVATMRACPRAHPLLPILPAVLLTLGLSITEQQCRAAMPTNASAAFRRFDLYADRIAAVGVGDHNNISSYPAFLNSDFLLVTRSPGDTVALFQSEPYDAILMGVGTGVPDSYVEYAVSPPQYATSLGLLSMAILVFNGTGAFADYGKPLISVRVTFTDGDTTAVLMYVGNQIRQWTTTQIFCTGQNPMGYVVPPDDPLAGVVYSDNVNGRYYDVQELPLPAVKRSKRIQSIRVRAV